jgi:hypothetical protein
MPERGRRQSPDRPAPLCVIVNAIGEGGKESVRRATYTRETRHASTDRSISRERFWRGFGLMKHFAPRRSTPRTPPSRVMVKTRIACYFDIPGPDNKPHGANFVDVREFAPPLRRASSLDARSTSVSPEVPRPPTSSRDRLPPTPPLPPPPHRSVRDPSQVDMRETDSKNELKKRVARKVGIPFYRLKMRLGPFNDVMMFDKESYPTLKVGSCAVSVACVDERLSGDQNTACNYFGAADHELPEFQDGTKKFEPHPFANWHQTWDDVEKFGATG